ncbi:MAG: hypothetical protein IJ719_15630 [Clostridia bacterium]|nr:hypothetical protein [Clostridia bacterium]
MKFLAMITCVLFLFSGLAIAENLVNVHCDEQAFSTKAASGLTAEWSEADLGFFVYAEHPGYVPFAFVSRRPTKFNDPVNYLDNVYREYMESRYGSVETNPCQQVEIGGKTLYCARYHYTTDENQLVLLRAIEIRNDGDVEYGAKFAEGQGNSALSVLDTLVRYYQPDASSDSDASVSLSSDSQEKILEEVHCAEQEFSTKIASGLSAEWSEDDLGFFVYAEHPGYVPFAFVSRRPTKFNDPVNYLNNVYREYMENSYDSVGTNPCQQVEIGGKSLYCAQYHYTTGGNQLVLLRAIEIRNDGDVEYGAKFIEGKSESALAVLDTIVRYYQPDSDVNIDSDTDTSLSPESTDSSTSLYQDERFSISLPDGWQIKTSGEYASFAFKAWDPDHPERTVFLMMKAEPFLKSTEAKEKYAEFSRLFPDMGSYSFFADAPVLSPVTVPAFLHLLPEIRTFSAKYAESGMSVAPDIFPEINNVTVLDAEQSDLPAPENCADNAVAIIQFENDAGIPCEGIVTAQPTVSMSYDLDGVDTWFNTVYLFTGVTAGNGELAELLPTLSRCLSSFTFAESYTGDASQSTDETTALMRFHANALQSIRNTFNSFYGAFMGIR